MMRRYPSLQDLTFEILDNPAFFGLSVYRLNPCCSKDQAEVSLHPHIAQTTYENAEDAATYFKALAAAIDELVSRFADKGEIATENWPCDSCWEAGDVDPAWLAQNPDATNEYDAALGSAA